MNFFWIFLEFLDRYFLDDLPGAIYGDLRKDKAAIVVELNVKHLIGGYNVEAKGDIFIGVPQ